jgi:hypothetical protein
MPGIEDDRIALPVGEHLHRFFFALRRIVAVGDDKLFSPGFRLA